MQMKLFFLNVVNDIFEYILFYMLSHSLSLLFNTLTKCLLATFFWQNKKSRTAKLVCCVQSGQKKKH